MVAILALKRSSKRDSLNLINLRAPIVEPFLFVLIFYLNLLLKLFFEGTYTMRKQNTQTLNQTYHLNLTKLTLISLGLTIGFLASSNAQAVTVYKTDDSYLNIGGRVQSNLHSVHASKSGSNEINNKVRLRFDGKTKINDWAKAIAFAEWEVAGQTKENGKFKTRYVYTGFETDDFGRFTFGQDHTALFNVTQATDLFTDWGSDGNTYWDLGARQEGQAIYHYDTDKVNIAATYQTASLEKVNSGYALAFGYTFDLTLPLKISVGHDSYNLKNSQDDKKSYAISLALGTNGDGFYAGTLYQKTHYDLSKNKDGFEIASSYTFEKPIKLIALYQTLRQDGAKLVDNITLEANYFFTKSIKTYLAAEIGVGDIDKVDVLGNKLYSTNHASNNLYTLGLQYNF